MRTTVTLDDDVAARLDSEMRETGKSFKQALNDALRSGLARRDPAGAPPPFVVQARELGRHAGVDYSRTSELLEVAEGPEHR